MSIRIQRLQELVLHRVAMVVLRDLNDPRVRLVTITKVKLAKDLSECRVYWSTLEEGGARSAVSHALTAATPFLQREVAAIMKTRVTPRLTLEFDSSIEGVERLSQILRSARAEDDERRRSRGETDEPEAASPAPEEPRA